MKKSLFSLLSFAFLLIFTSIGYCEDNVEQQFIEINQKYQNALVSTTNDIQQRLLLKQRKQEFASWNFNGKAENWIGTVSYLSATGDDVRIDIEIAPKIILSVSTTIDNPLVSVIASLYKGQRVMFSGSLASSNDTFFYERSITTRGGLEEPEYKFTLTKINKF